MTIVPAAGTLAPTVEGHAMRGTSLILFLLVVGCGAGGADATDAARDAAADVLVGPDATVDAANELVDVLPTPDDGSDADEAPDLVETAEPLVEAVDDVAREAGAAEAEPFVEAPTEAPAEIVDEVEALDDAAPDVWQPLPGFGALSGECGVFDEAAWASSEPRFFVNHLDFGANGYDAADHDLLTAGGQTVLDEPNAGGSSQASEAFAFEVLARCELAELLKTELPIDYVDEQGKITDLLVLVDGRKLGVSVTRAMSWPYDAAYTLAAASALLEKKLLGIQASTANVAPNDAWVRQTLSVLAYGDAHAQVLRQAWDALPADVRADTWVYVTVSDGDDLFLY